MSPTAEREGFSGPVLILGPTASGKSSLAMGLADELPVEIVNADALQVFRGVDVGTAKPTVEERDRVPHHLIDILDPGEEFSAGEFARRARPIIEQVLERRRLPLVVGGTGLYLRALTVGLSPIPPVPPAIRREVRRQLAEEGLPAVRRRLATVDPATAAELGPQDTQRILRALEVVLATGRGLTDWWRVEPAVEPLEPLAKVGLTLPRALLYDRITRRTQRMAEAGWVDEVKELLAGGCLPTAPAFRAIGYRQVLRHIRGEWPLDRALDEAARETRRFAKRQLTWFRREPDVEWLDAQSLDEALPRVLDVIRRRRGGEG